MLIHFKLAWMKSGASVLKAFKNPSAAALFEDYTRRSAKYGACKVSALGNNFSAPEGGVKRWVCDRGPGAEIFPSDGIAKKIQTLQLSGVRELEILIGGPDGFSAEELKKLKPEIRWSFGPMTLPHELAAIVASEQIYRAWTILHHHPYHQGH